MNKARKNSSKFMQDLIGHGHSLQVKASFILNLYPEITSYELKQYALKGVIDNAELYSGPLPVSVAIKLEGMGITSIAKINEEIRAGKLDLSKFNYIGPKKWLAIMKWARIDFSSDKIIAVSLKLPMRIISELSDMAGAADYKLKHPAIAYLVDCVLAASRTLRAIK